MSLSWKKITVPILAFCAIAAFAQDYHADHPNYLHFRVGSQSFDDADAAAFYLKEFTDRFEVIPAGLQVVSLETNDLTIAVTEGYHFNKWVALEGTLSWSGDQDLIATGENIEYRLTSEFFDFELVGLFTWYFKPWLFGYAKAGGNLWSLGFETPPFVTTHEDGPDTLETFETNYQGISLALGAGLQVSFNEQYSLALSWDQTKIDDLDVTRVSLGVGFIF